MNADVIELVPIQDIYADDLAAVEVIGPNIRLTYFTWQNGERIVVCKLVRPLESVANGPALKMLARETAKPKVLRAGTH